MRVAHEVGFGLCALSLLGLTTLVLAPREPARVAKLRVTSFEGSGEHALRWPAASVATDTRVAIPMRGKFGDVYDDDDGYPPYPISKWLPGEVIGADCCDPFLESLLVEAAVNRYVADGKVELSVRTAAPLDGSGEGGDWFRVDLGRETRIDELGYRDLLAGYRLGELVVRTRERGHEVLHVCAIGASRWPSCIQFVLRSPTSLFRVDIGSDATVTVRGFDGPRVVHERYSLQFP